MFTSIKNKTIYKDKYKLHDEAVVISCFFNPQKSDIRVKNAKIFYESIKHLNHRIIECSINNSPFYLPETKYIKRLNSDTWLWHKEALLNNIIRDLPKKFKYVFWLDADILFDNNNWLVEGVKQLNKCNLIQPFSTCYHLDEGQNRPNLSTQKWYSFCSNYINGLYKSHDYNTHGHVGFAWGARREILDQCFLYDKALIGGADHIIAHAASGIVPHHCIKEAFKDNLSHVIEWSKRFSKVCADGYGYTRLGYVNGDLFHLWHGDVAKRDYYNRIKRFTPMIAKSILKKNNNGLYYQPSQNNDRSGGNLLGYFAAYMLGREMVKDNDQFTPGSGSFGGAGANASWEENKDVDVVEKTGITNNVIFS